MVYLIKAESGIVKIGYTSRNPKQRLKEIQRTHSEKLELICTIDGDVAIEHQLYEKFKKYNVYGEWFNLPEEIIGHIVKFKNKKKIKKSLDNTQDNNETMYKSNVYSRLLFNLRNYIFALIDATNCLYSKKQIKDIFNEAFFEAVLDILGNKENEEAKDAA